ncbi:MAG: EBNA-1 nuclear protein [Rhodospirillaceae bacterium]|nr:EBNA-1 nuclear protein [Rhodospirillaceae bacterium]
MEIRTPYLLFLGDARDQLAAKTAYGVRVWRPDWCVGQRRLAECNADCGIPDMTIKEAQAAGVKTVILGVANRGGVIPKNWTSELVDAVNRGMDVASGLHTKITEIPELVDAANMNDRLLLDVRHPTRNFDVADGVKRNGKRLLTVGTDVSVGKMFTSLAIEREMHQRGMNASFRATGQTGIFIASAGVSIDAVVADFISGAVEWLTPENDADHWDVVEGQGSLFNVSYAGVTLGLIHGAQPDALVVCHEAGRPHMRSMPHFPVIDIPTCIEANLEAARLTNPDVRCIGASINTSSLTEQDGRDFCKRIGAETGLPTVDPLRDGVAAIVDNL